MFVVLMFFEAHLSGQCRRTSLVGSQQLSVPDYLFCSHSLHIARTFPSGALPGKKHSGLTSTIVFKNLDVPDEMVLSRDFDVTLSALVGLLFLMHNL